MLANSLRPPISYAPRPHMGYSTGNSSGLSTKTIICIVVIFVVVLFTIVGVVAIALGVGLGVGLNRSDSSSSSDASQSSTTIGSSVTTSSTSQLTVSATTTTTTTTTTPCPTCGCSSVSINSSLARIINGNNAIPHSWPWIIALYKYGGFTCGGALISYKHVLTAAHCVYDLSPSSLTVYAGLHILSDAPTSQYRDVSSIWVHPSYTRASLDYDIAILKLSSDFIGTGTVSLACLPPANNSIPTNNEKAMAIGWGKMSISASITESSTLQQVVLQVHNTARSCYVGSRIDQQFCAGFGETGTCSGDSGGPLMTNVNGAWTLTGVVNYGLENCDGSSGFARVSYYRSLIDTQLKTM
ncbi:hypothetical protein I4U23_001912 [Adineta vaga]|nr:hypothetical protein I4U23_001912 [Adineta vaga]